MSAFAPLNHFVYPVLDVECCCALCVTWRRKRDDFDEMKRLTLTHNRSCMCWRCRKRREYQTGFLAAAAKREFYSEMSFHANSHPAYGARLMQFAAETLQNNTESDGWWSTLAQAYSLSYWFAQFQASLYPEDRGKLVDLETHRAATWCGWCGDDLPEGRSLYCSEACEADYQAHELALNAPKRQRARISMSDMVSYCGTVLSGMVSVTMSPAVSGMAA